MTQIELKVKGMTCGHCEMRVKKALEAVPGVESAKPDHKKGVAIIDVSDDVSKETLAKAVNDTGLYMAEV